MSSTIRIASALLAPLALGACGLPIGVQIASLFADGVSYLTTDKSLTDHGISAVTGEDCALWRGVEGNSICRADDGGKDAGTIVAALNDQKRQAPQPVIAEAPSGDAGLPSEMSAGWSDAPAKSPTIVALAKPEPKPAARAMAEVRDDSLILGTDRSAPMQPVKRVKLAEVKLAEALPPPPPPAPKLTAAAKLPAPRAVAAPKLQKAAMKLPAKALPRKAATADKATYYIIASYRHAADADKFSKRHGKLQSQVIEGTANGRQVFRVAVGPIQRKDSRATKERLKQAGFKDTWRLTLESTPFETEVAAVR
ncbi:MAG: SPOR domain-containing protein [Rhodospirillaceae bacterium]